MIEEIGKILVSRGQTLALAESCTGGKISARIVTNAGVSTYYLGSVIAYANSIKEDVLGVSPNLLRAVGAVSAPVALDMARGAQALTGATWTLSVTGIAGPTGGTDDKPVGTVWFGLVGPGIERAEHKLFQGARAQIQEDAVTYGLEILNKTLKGET
jgi:nicotinamide-nucleotide amidase